MKKMINITDCSFDTDRYKDGQDAADFVRRFCCDGFELMHCIGGKLDFFPSEDIVGVHLRFFNEWIDLWKGDMAALEAEYDTLKQAEEVFGSLEREGMIKPLTEDLETARRLGASYVVFHVSDVKMTELFTYTFSHTDEEVVDYTAELVNDLLDGKGYEFDFLMENLWWPGLTLTRPEITRRLLDQIHYPKKGIMLDTGHLMHTNLELAAQEEAVDYILDMVRAHSDMIPYMKGIHLNQSLTGQYVKDLLKKRDEMPKTHKERVSACYEHVFQIDGHFPFTTPRVREIIEAVAPDYLTYELITSDREEHEKKLLRQCEALGVMVDGV